MNQQQQYMQNQAPPPGPPQGMPIRPPVIRPSPLPANAPTEAELLRDMNPDNAPSAGPPPPMPRPQGPPGGLGPGIQPSREDVLMMAAQRRMIPELLKTAEAASLQTAVQNGGPGMLNTFLYQFVFGQMDPQRREILLQVIKFYMMKGAYGPQFTTPQFLNVQGSISPTSPTSPKAGPPGPNLAVSPLPGRERVPSPQEMALHAQQIMQNALIKRKLEEQKENYRR